MGILNNNIINEHIGESFRIDKIDNLIKFTLSDGSNISDTEEYITKFCQEIIGIKYDSVLILGGAIGVVAQYIANNTTCSIIDVIEIEEELVNWVNKENYLDNKINYMHGNAFRFTPKKQYDLIIIDLWWDRELAIESEDLLLKLYGNYVKSYLYIPILEKIITKKQ